jgi:hypothetical protein
MTGPGGFQLSRGSGTSSDAPVGVGEPGGLSSLVLKLSGQQAVWWRDQDHGQQQQR